MTQKEQTCWIVVEDGLTGTLNQCLGVAEALGLETTIKPISLRQPWKTLTPWLGLEQSWTFKPPITPPWPDVLITAGRKAIAASLYIKKKNPQTFTVHLQDPKIAPHNFDLVAAPAHDNYTGPNVITTTAAPNRVTLASLSTHPHFAEFANLNSPRVAVLIGGNSHTHTLTPQIMNNLVAQLKSLNAGLMITTSRRTGEKNLEILQNSGLKAYIWDGTGDNPYLSMLASADYIIVTNDSVSMLSDAGSTGKPVYIVELEGGSPKFNRLYKTLQDKNVIKPFAGNLQPWTYEPLNDAQLIANEITRNRTAK